MSNKVDAAAKDAEGRLEFAIGDLTGDTGCQIKGKAKQAAQSVAVKVSHAAQKVADDLS